MDQLPKRENPIRFHKNYGCFLIIKPAEETIHFIRFGAGEDRLVMLRRPARIGKYIRKWIKRVVG